MSSDSEYSNIKIPKEIKDSIVSLIANRPELAFKTTAEFVKNAIRDKLMSYQLEDQISKEFEAIKRRIEGLEAFKFSIEQRQQVKAGYLERVKELEDIIEEKFPHLRIQTT